MSKPAHCSPKIAGVVLLATFSFLWTTSSSAQPFAVEADEPGGPSYLAGEVLVQFKPGATDAQLLDAVRGAGLGLIKHIQTPAMDRQGHPGVSRMSTGLPVRHAIAALRNHPAVESVQPNWVYQHCETSNDPYYTGGNLWGLYGDESSPANQYGSQAAEAWADGATGSDTVYVGVIDEGIMYTHPDLADNIWTNPFDPVDSTDNDGNGYVDDIHGWDFYSNNNSVYDGSSDDHATHVAGTIGAVGGNGIGVVGVNWQVTMISAKFLGPYGGSTADAIDAIDYFVDLKTRHGLNVVALNNSWGGGGYDALLLAAIGRAANEEILFVAAAGNSGVNTDTTPFYPSCYATTEAGYDAVIAVAAIDSSGNLASFSNYGATTVDLGAPGASIYSTVPNRRNQATYASYSGTSMATPHVTGAIALYASTHPGASAAVIRNAILNATAPTTSLSGKTVTGGRLDLSTVIGGATPPTTPAPPTGLTAIAGDRQVTLTWTASEGATSYKVYRNAPTESYTVVATVSTTSYTDTGLVNGTTYAYYVTAVNSAGESDPSDEVSATPVAQPPAAPSALTAKAVSKYQINLSWTDNSNNEDGFRIERQMNGPFEVVGTVGVNVRTYSDTGLTRNTTYSYRVRAYNNAGDSDYSNTVTTKTKR